jgi:hypothetical protein
MARIHLKRSVSIPGGQSGLTCDPIQVAQGEDELEQAFEAGMIVVKCWDPGCLLHRLPHWPEEVWIPVQPREYEGYSHGICRLHLRQYQREAERFSNLQPVVQATEAIAVPVLAD